MGLGKVHREPQGRTEALVQQLALHHLNSAEVPATPHDEDRQDGVEHLDVGEVGHAPRLPPVSGDNTDQDRRQPGHDRTIVPIKPTEGVGRPLQSPSDVRTDRCMELKVPCNSSNPR